jgi:colanic acid/amylovoran biosynthesis protein
MPDAELRACLSADVVVDLSGDMLTDDYGPHVAYSHYIPIVNTLVLGRPLVLCAQSIGPFRWTGAIARRLMTRASVITVRDELSRHHLTAIGLNGAAVPRTGDMAFLLPPAPQRRAREILTEASVPHEDGVPTMSVSLSRSVQRQYDRSRPSGAAPFVPLMAGVLDRFSAESGCRVLFVPHVTGPFPDRDERRLAHAVAGSMSCPSHVLPGDYRPEEIKAVIATCDLHVGGRMHANIAALGSGVPVVALSYSHKTPGIMRLFGQSDCVIDGRALTAGELLALLRGVWSRRAAVRRDILTALADVTRGARQNVDIIAGLVDRRSPAPATAGAP